MILWHLREDCLKMHFWQCSNIGRKMENQQHKVETPSKLIENKCQCSNNCTNRRTKKIKIPFTKGVAKNFVCAHKGAPHTMRAFPRGGSKTFHVHMYNRRKYISTVMNSVILHLLYTHQHFSHCKVPEVHVTEVNSLLVVSQLYT